MSDCLRAWQTGALRRSATGGPFEDVIVSERTPQRERRLADHPSLKPQSLLRQLVCAALPLGVGVVADPFMGSGSTAGRRRAPRAHRASASSVSADFVTLARQAVPKLAVL
ncbi:MAG: DNA methyltransferase [Tetrasphaera sp.]